MIARKPRSLIEWRRFAALLLGAIALNAEGAEPDALRETRRRLKEGEPLRIVCFGDSITGAYYHTGGVWSWSDLLARALQAAHPAAALSVHNAGVSGNTTAAALARMERDVLSREPHVVVVMFGMNDVAGVAPSEFARNLATIIGRSRTGGAEVLLLTPNHVLAGDPQRPPDRVAAYAEIVRQVARETGQPLVDCHRRFADEAKAGGYRWARLMSDAIHPNLHGHRLIAEAAARVFLGRPELPTIVSAAFEPTAARAPPPSPRALKVLATDPLDELVREVLRSVAPDRPASVARWAVAGKSLAEMIDETQRRGRWRNRAHADADGGRPDLLVLAMPVPEGGASDEECFRDYSALINGSLSFGAPEWELWVLLPPAADSSGAGQHVGRAREIAADVLASKGLRRAILPDDNAAAPRRGLEERLRQWLR